MDAHFDRASVPQGMWGLRNHELASPAASGRCAFVVAVLSSAGSLCGELLHRQPAELESFGRSSREKAHV
jgi:hypothetical protein